MTVNTNSKVDNDIFSMSDFKSPELNGDIEDILGINSEEKQKQQKEEINRQVEAKANEMLDKMNHFLNRVLPDWRFFANRPKGYIKDLANQISNMSDWVKMKEDELGRKLEYKEKNAFALNEAQKALETKIQDRQKQYESIAAAYRSVSENKSFSWFRLPTNLGASLNSMNAAKFKSTEESLKNYFEKSERSNIPYQEMFKAVQESFGLSEQKLLHLLYIDRTKITSYLDNIGSSELRGKIKGFVNNLHDKEAIAFFAEKVSTMEKNKKEALEQLKKNISQSNVGEIVRIGKYQYINVFRNSENGSVILSKKESPHEFLLFANNEIRKPQDEEEKKKIILFLEKQKGEQKENNNNNVHIHIETGNNNKSGSNINNKKEEKYEKVVPSNQAQNTNPTNNLYSSATSANNFKNQQTPVNNVAYENDIAV